MKRGPDLGTMGIPPRDRLEIRREWVVSEIEKLRGELDKLEGEQGWIDLNLVWHSRKEGEARTKFQGACEAFIAKPKNNDVF